MEQKFLPINGQKLCEYANLRLGWRKFAANGCGILAIYNALGLTGRRKKVEEIHRYFHAWYRPRFFGIHPWKLRRYFRKNKIECKTASSVEELDRYLKDGNVAVLTYWNRVSRVCGLPNLLRGAHSVCVRFDGKFTVYNRFSNRDHAYDFETLEDCLNGHVYMMGFVLSTG